MLPSCLHIDVDKCNRETRILVSYYGKMCSSVTDVAKWSPYIVAKELISSDFSLELQSIKSHSKQVQMLLQHIIGPVEGGNVQVFYDFVDVMQQHGVLPTKQLAMEMRNDSKVSLLSVVYFG